MKALATILGLCGAFMLALNIGLTFPAYCVMLTSSLLFIGLFWKSEREIVALNSGFGLLNILGLTTSF